MAVYDTYQLRFPPGMRELLEEAAKKNNRSLHAEVLDRLRASMEGPSIEMRVSNLERQVADLAKKGK